MKKSFLNTQDHINSDIKNLVLHLKYCQKNNRFKNGLYLSLNFLKDNCIKKTITTTLVATTIMTIGMILFL